MQGKTKWLDNLAARGAAAAIAVASAWTVASGGAEVTEVAAPPREDRKSPKSTNWCARAKINFVF